MDLPENLSNARMHWKAKYRAKKRYYAAQDARQSFGLIEPPPTEPLASVRVLAHLRLYNAADPDGCAARLKWPMDWLVTRGYLEDDGPAIVKELRVTQEIDRRNQRLEITLEPLDPTSDAP